MVGFEAEEDAEEPVRSEKDEVSEEEDQHSVEFVDLHIPTYIAAPHTPFSCSCVHPE